MFKVISDMMAHWYDMIREKQLSFQLISVMQRK